MTEGDLRERILSALERRLVQTGGVLTRDELSAFPVDGSPRRLIDTSRGIWNPTWLEATLSILSSPDGPYSDEVLGGGLVRYAYRSGGVGGDNTKLRRAVARGLPVIYLRKIEPGVFVVFPRAYVVRDDVPNERFLIAVHETLRLAGPDEPTTDIERRYVTREIQQRLHQPIFRARVLHAYETRCAVCKLRHGELLDAAHILPDRDERGVAAVQNGLSLCKIHHSAYDENLLGITPDATVEIRGDLLDEQDGPMLQHGLKAMHRTPILLPRRKVDRPDRNALALRYELFRRSA